MQPIKTQEELPVTTYKVSALTVQGGSHALYPKMLSTNAVLIYVSNKRLYERD